MAADMYSNQGAAVLWLGSGGRVHESSRGGQLCYTVLPLAQG